MSARCPKYDLLNADVHIGQHHEVMDGISSDIYILGKGIHPWKQRRLTPNIRNTIRITWWFCVVKLKLLGLKRKRFAKALNHIGWNSFKRWTNYSICGWEGNIELISTTTNRIELKPDEIPIFKICIAPAQRNVKLNGIGSPQYKLSTWWNWIIRNGYSQSSSKVR